MFLTMTKVVRFLCMWMLLLALPVQGFAQASMFACHLKGSSPADMGMMDHSMMNHAEMDHAEMDHAGTHHGPVDSDDLKQVKKSLHGCCNCAPTCAALPMLLSQADFIAIQHDNLQPVTTSQLPHSADTRRIDRPPKNLAI
jgi:hypothetical protein